MAPRGKNNEQLAFEYEFMSPSAAEEAVLESTIMEMIKHYLSNPNSRELRSYGASALVAKVLSWVLGVRHFLEGSCDVSRHVANLLGNVGTRPTGGTIDLTDKITVPERELIFRLGDRVFDDEEPAVAEDVNQPSGSETTETMETDAPGDTRKRKAGETSGGPSSKAPRTAKKKRPSRFIRYTLSGGVILPNGVSGKDLDRMGFRGLNFAALKGEATQIEGKTPRYSYGIDILRADQGTLASGPCHVGATTYLFHIVMNQVFLAMQNLPDTFVRNNGKKGDERRTDIDLYSQYIRESLGRFKVNALKLEVCTHRKFSQMKIGDYEIPYKNGGLATNGSSLSEKDKQKYWNFVDPLVAIGALHRKSISLFGQEQRRANAYRKNKKAGKKETDAEKAEAHSFAKARMARNKALDTIATRMPKVTQRAFLNKMKTHPVSRDLISAFVGSTGANKPAVHNEFRVPLALEDFLGDGSWKQETDKFQRNAKSVVAMFPLLAPLMAFNATWENRGFTEFCFGGYICRSALEELPVKEVKKFQGNLLRLQRIVNIMPPALLAASQREDSDGKVHYTSAFRREHNRMDNVSMTDIISATQVTDDQALVTALNQEIREGMAENTFFKGEKTHWKADDDGLFAWDAPIEGANVPTAPGNFFVASSKTG